MSSNKENESLEIFSLLSHEIRTPLNAVVGISDLLQKPHSEEVRQEYYRILKTTSENLLELVNNILDYSKLSHGSLKVTDSAFEIREKITSSLYAQNLIATSKKLDFSIVFDPNIPDRVVGDQVKISQIFVNLVSNAIKFTKEGSVNVEVNCKNQENRDLILMAEIRDTGIGIPKGQKDKIFKAFHQGEDDINIKYAGTGLGLNITRDLIKLLGGEISVSSEMGKGSCFSFYVPLKITHSPNKESADVKEKLVNLRGKKALVAEDNKLNSLILYRFLKTWGMEVVQVANGKRALEEISKNNFDVVLMDIHMPQMNGFEAVERLRCMSEGKKSSLPVIALSAAVEEMASKSLLTSRFNAVVHKPFDAGELKKTIRKVITSFTKNSIGKTGECLVNS